MSLDTTGVKTPFPQELMQSKPLIAEVSLTAIPPKPARPNEALRVRLNVLVRHKKKRYSFTAAVCVWYEALGALVKHRHAIVLKQCNNDLYATHITSSGMYMPLLSC